MAEQVWIKDVWLTARQWDLVRDALVQRGTKQADKVRERIWGQLILTPGYRRYMQQSDRSASGEAGSLGSDPVGSGGGSGVRVPSTTNPPLPEQMIDGEVRS